MATFKVSKAHPLQKWANGGGKQLLEHAKWSRPFLDRFNVKNETNYSAS